MSNAPASPAVISKQCSADPIDCALLEKVDDLARIFEERHGAIRLGSA
jgi:uncharacterized glyoxalase superfamily metalloenzyme YdcJ